jgi:hypothetical protein
MPAPSLAKTGVNLTLFSTKPRIEQLLWGHIIFNRTAGLSSSVFMALRIGRNRGGVRRADQTPACVKSPDGLPVKIGCHLLADIGIWSTQSPKKKGRTLKPWEPHSPKDPQQAPLTTASWPAGHSHPARCPRHCRKSRIEVRYTSDPSTHTVPLQRHAV